MTPDRTHRRSGTLSRIFVAVRSIDQFDPYYFDEHGVGVEIQDLLRCDMTDDAVAAVIARYRERLFRFRGPIALHACVPSPAAAIDAHLLAQRYRTMIAAAASLNASTIVFHSGIDPSRSADDAGSDDLTAFWSSLRGDIEKAGITAALENVLEDDYRPLLSLVRRIDSPRVGICLDLGHHHLNSRQVIEEWLFNLSHHIRHIHIHTNGGTDDEHSPLTDAALRRLIGLCADHDIAPDVSFEYRDMSAEMIRREAGRLRKAVGDGSHPVNTRFPGQMRSFLMQIALPAALALLLFGALIFGFIIPKYEDIILDQKRGMLRELVRSALSIATRLEKDARGGRISGGDARREAAILIGQMRYGPELKDYFWITDMHPRMITHPYRTDLNGTDLSGFTDPGGKRLFAAFVAMVRSNGGGYVDYRWQWKDDPATVVPKLSYVEGFTPWGWIIGTGMYVEDVKHEIAIIERRLILIALGITALVAVILAYLARTGFRIDRRRMITEESLRAAREKYRLLVEASTEGILMCAGSSIIFSNAPVRAMLGWTEDELAAIDPDSLFTSGTAASWLAAGMRTAARFESSVRTKSGVPFDALIIASPVSFAGRDGVIVIIRNASADTPARPAYDLTQPPAGDISADVRSLVAVADLPVAGRAVPAACAHYNDSVQHVIREMNTSRADALIVTGDRQEMLGIITDSMIRQWLADGGKDAPAHTIMRAPVPVVAGLSPAFEADLAAERAGCDWVAVRTEGGLGIWRRDTSISMSPISQLLRAIDNARSAEEIRSIHDRLPHIASLHIECGLAPRLLTRTITAVTGAIVRRYCSLTEADIGPPPCAYAFITLGSVARGEQTLISDQDNAIIYADGGRENYFHELGQRVCVLLNRTGYAYCDGRIMAKNERWCAPVSRWKDYYAGWARTGNPEDILDLSIFYDIRAVSGEQRLTDELCAHIAGTVPLDQPLIHHLARIAHDRRLPLSALGNIQPDVIEGKRDMLDLKKTMLAAVDAARVFSLHAGIPAADTAARITQMVKSGIIAPSDGEGVIAAYGSLMDMRIRHQLQCITERRQPDNIIDIKALTEFDHDVLRAAVNRLAFLQRTLERSFSINA